jgi:hypothetical protein
MRRIILATTFLATLALLYFPTPVRGQALPSRKEAADWISKAEAASRLDAPGMPPFHLVAKIHYALGDQNLDGTYEILWAAPDRYRLELRLGNIGETDVILGDKKYVERTTPTMSLPMWSVTKLFGFDFPARSSGPVNYHVNKLTYVNDGSTPHICATVNDSSLHRQFCFDAASRGVVSEHTLVDSHSLPPNWAFSTDLTDYKSLGQTRFPQKLAIHIGPGAVEAKIEKWEPVQTFGENIFVPLSIGKLWDWCATPEIRQPSHPPPANPLFIPYGASSTTQMTVAYVALYKVVAPDGRTVVVEPILATPTDHLNALVEQQRRSPSPVHSCDGKAIQYETTVEFWITAVP